jgi:membrane associated rhomboid family serine protease
MSQFRFRPVSGLPYAVKNLIILNVIFFIAKFFAAARGIDLDRVLGMHHPLSPYFHFWQIVTHMFMHGDIMHLLFNMLGLYFFGRMLENVWGHKRFLIYYFICGLGACAIYIGWETFATLRALNVYGEGWTQLKIYAANYTEITIGNPAAGLIFGSMVGASGAIFGLLMGAALLFPNSVIYIYGAIPIKLKWLAVIYGVLELYTGSQAAEGDNVAHFAHIGGMIFGFILVQIYKRSRNNFY